MAIDLKYGKVTIQNGSIGEDEPIVIFRARDELLPRMLEYYSIMCVYAACGDWHLELIERARHAVSVWQREHVGEVRKPTSEGARLWLVTQEDPPPEPPPPATPAAQLDPLPSAETGASVTEEATVS